jgi:hypothetical protein
LRKKKIILMNPESSLATHRHYRIDAAPAAVLPALCHSTPLYVHAGNWMADLAAITDFTECLVDDDWLSFPEQGLALSLPAIQHLHTIAIDRRSSLAMEIATPGEPRAVSIAAIPAASDLDQFAERLSYFPTKFLNEKRYQEWRSQQLIRPAACKRCVAAAEERRLHMATNPLGHIFANAVKEGLTLHCELTSPVFRFAVAITPGEILFDRGHLGITGNDQLSMLEIDTGLCHSLDLRRRLVDDEPMTVLSIFNSLGAVELTLQTPGFTAYENWLQLCQP